MNILEVIGQLMNSTTSFSAALILAALGGICSERAGVVNIGLEGLMTAGAFAAAVTADYAARGGAGGMSPWLGLIGAVLFASLFSLLHAVATVTFKSNQVVTGVVINFLALGIGVYLVKSLYDGSGQTDTLKEVFHQITIPYTSEIPLLGEALFHAYPTSYLTIVLTAVVWYALFHSRYGLRLRAVGEHPGAADTVGIRVSRYRYAGVMLSGVLAGLGGAVVTLTTTSSFAHNTISGQGFIALAAMIFGRYHPIGAAAAALFFGLAQALRSFVQLFDWSEHIPMEFLYMLPYVLTLIVLASAIGKSRPPAALGEPYEPARR